MKPIIRFRYENLRNEAHVEFNGTFSALVEKYGAATLGISPLFDVYRPIYAEEVALLDTIRKSGYTAELDAQDHVRDGIYRGFTDAIKSALNHFDAAKREAAHRLSAVFDHYGNIASRSYDEETAAIDDLLRELATGANATALSTLALNDWAAQLHAENRAFDALIRARYSETATRPTTRMRTARIATDTALRAILYHMEALVTVNGETAYAPFINELNAVSDRYKNILAQQAGQRKAKTKTTDN
jgi:enamine deaminase RidA (YjgF/YER057c/UK114 family)